MGSPYDSSRRTSSLQRSVEFPAFHPHYSPQQYHHHYQYRFQPDRYHNQFHSSQQQRCKKSPELSMRNGSESCLSSVSDNNHASGFFSSLSNSNPNVSTSMRQQVNSGK